jgi:hypothetical protein
MTPLPTGKPIIPFTPTVDVQKNPTVCKACGCMSIGLGRSTPGDKSRPPDPGYLCKPCIVATGDLTKLDRISLYEVKALEKGVEAVGEWIAANGGVTELAHYDELMQLMLVKAAWRGCAEGIREALREAPF